jgi:hypothetical protein
MRIMLLALTALAGSGALAQQPGVPAPEAAQARAGPSDEDVPVNQVLVYGDDPCPASTDEVINVCARLPEQERFRIPPNLRSNPNDPAGQAWAGRAVELSYVGASGIGSCSPTGPGGAAGCFNQIVQQARAERRGAPDVNWNALIEQARQERLRRIEEAIMDEERAGQPPETPRPDPQ